jgi:hypothetical protein
MAAPHVAGAAAILKQRHPTWTVAQVKSALATTGDPVRVGGAQSEVSASREGGGRIDLVRADNPLVFVAPTGLSFGLVTRGQTMTRTFDVSDAGGGPLPWSVSVAAQNSPTGSALAVPATVVPGTTVTVTLTSTPTAVEGEGVGFIVLSRGADTRRMPYWFRMEAPRLGTEPHTLLRAPGHYSGNTRGKPALVSRYRYPETSSSDAAIPLDLSGPEQVFRFEAKQPLTNFGAAVTSHAPGVKVSPRLVMAGDENRLVGQTGLPANINPYQLFGQTTTAVGAVLTAAGSYDFVFDTPARGRPGRFAFRFWVDDTTPPSIRLLARSSRIRFAVSDRGSGVDPASIRISVDGRSKRFTYADGIVAVTDVTPGRHTVTLRVSDYQETKNMEDVGPILPNTRTLKTSVTVG